VNNGWVRLAVSAGCVSISGAVIGKALPSIVIFYFRYESRSIFGQDIQYFPELNINSATAWTRAQDVFLKQELSRRVTMVMD
jgi:hypothetical protein